MRKLCSLENLRPIRGLVTSTGMNSIFCTSREVSESDLKQPRMDIQMQAPNKALQKSDLGWEKSVKTEQLRHSQERIWAEIHFKRLWT